MILAQNPAEINFLDELISFLTGCWNSALSWIHSTAFQEICQRLIHSSIPYLKLAVALVFAAIIVYFALALIFGN